MKTAELSGSCLCGAVRFRLKLPTLFCAHCHCSMCRRAHGAGFVTWVIAAREHFEMVAGEDGLTHYRSSDHGTRSFCRHCGSTLFFKSTHRGEYIDVVLANIEGEIDRLPEFHAYFDDRAKWVHVADGLPQLGGVTGLEPL